MEKFAVSAIVPSNLLGPIMEALLRYPEIEETVSCSLVMSVPTALKTIRGQTEEPKPKKRTGHSTRAKTPGIRATILSILDEKGGFLMKDLYRLGIGGQSSISSAVSNLKKEGRIESITPGVYRALVKEGEQMLKENENATLKDQRIP